MDIAKGDLVTALAGRERGKLFFVMDVQDEYLLLADGKARRLEAPKRKKRKHVQREVSSPNGIAAKIRSSEIITNNELRKAIAAHRGGNGNQDQEGSTLWQNPT